MYSLTDVEKDYWIVISDDPKTLQFDIIHVQKGECFSCGRNHVKPFLSEELAIKYIRNFIPFYTKKIDTSHIVKSDFIETGII